MSKVLVSQSLLQNIANAIRSVNSSSNTYTLAQMPTEINKFITCEKVYTGTVTANTDNTTATNLTTITIPSDIYVDTKILYVKIRDNAGKREGYFYGSDSFLLNYRIANNTTSTYSGCHLCYKYTSSAIAVAEGSYGVYGYTASTANKLVIRTRYHSSYSLTINGTYNVEVYLIGWPGENDFSPTIT